ncbi:MAG: MarR family transcriptional regulator [Gammaproteobacteria bacterium]|nr:MarR family transcriptional regulator [Gammaproteobacteria bacterium]
MERRSTHFRGRGLVRTTWQPITQAQWLCSYWLKRADRRISTSFAVDLKAWGIIASEWAALREMYRPGRNSSLGLATAIGMTKGGASKLVDRLVRKGLARRTVGELDRRCRPVGLTRRGKNFVWHLAMREEDIDHEFFGKDIRRRGMMRALKRLVHAWRDKRVYVWDVPAWKAPSGEGLRYYSAAARPPSAAPPPSAVASNASNSSDDSSRNLPRDK